MNTTTYTQSNTFTVTHAKQISSKIAADLQRFQRFYGEPTNERIKNYELELIQLLQHDVLKDVTYGFKRNDMWTEATVKYTASSGSLGANDDPGKIRPNLDIEGASFSSFLTYNSKWDGMSAEEKLAIRSECPFQREGNDMPQLEKGLWSSDHTYSAGGRGMGRSSVKIYE